MNPQSPVWEDFEKAIAEVERQLVGTTATVTHNEHILGRSGRKRQCDVTIRSRVGSHPVLVVLECKKLKRRVSITQAEAFSSKLQDVGANVGVLVSASGFTAGAIAVSERYGIRLMSYREARETDWNEILAKMSPPTIMWAAFTGSTLVSPNFT